MYTLQYYNGKEWTYCSEWENPNLVWSSLGGDNYNYRVIDEDGNIVKENF